MSDTPLYVRTQEALAAVLSPSLCEDAIQLLDAPQTGYLASQARLFETLRSLEPLVSAPPASIQDAHKLTEALAECARVTKQMEEHRRARLKPLESETKAINAVYAAFRDPIAAWVVRGKRAELAYLQAERARAEREQEEHRRRIEAAALAEAEALAKRDAAKNEAERAAAIAEAEAASQEQALATVTAPLEAPRVLKGEAGSSGLREGWVLHGIHDLDAIPRGYWRDPDVIAALTKVLARAVRGGVHEIPGCSVGLEEGIQVRTA